MKGKSIVTKVPWLVAGAVAAVLIPGSLPRGSHQALGAGTTAAAPSHRVIACYFHRTNRCPTCKKISAYSEESLRSGFAAQLKDGRLRWLMIDFQDPRNRQYTRYYKITGPTLLIMDVHDGKATQWKPMPKVWSLVGKKEAFFKYVQDEVRRCMDERSAHLDKEVK